MSAADIAAIGKWMKSDDGNGGKLNFSVRTTEGFSENCRIKRQGSSYEKRLLESNLTTLTYIKFPSRPVRVAGERLVVRPTCAGDS